MSDDDLKGFIEDVIADMVKSGELEAGDEFESEDEDVEIEIDSEEEVELDEAHSDDHYEEDDMKEEMKSKKDGMDEEMKSKKDNDKKAVDEAKAKDDEEKKKMKEELEEANATINTLRSSLNEVNLLNAKLLYTNKIFKSKNLTESQKVKVLGAFDKAGTVKETKLVFETLNEGLKAKKPLIKESLGAASKATGNFKSKNPIIKTDPMVERFQKLAGLK